MKNYPEGFYVWLESARHYWKIVPNDYDIFYKMWLDRQEYDSGSTMNRQSPAFLRIT